MIIYSELESAVKSAGKVQTEIEGYISEIKKTIKTPISNLPGSDSKGYASTASQLAQNKINQLNKKSEKFASIEKKLNDVVTTAKSKDSNVSGRIEEIANSVIGKRKWYQAVGDWLYNTFCVDLANSNFVFEFFADCYEWAHSRYEKVKEIVVDWFKYGDGKYILNIALSVAGTIAAIAGAIAAVAAAPFTGGASLAGLILCIGAVASCVTAAIATINTIATVYDNGKALSLSGNIFDGYDGKPGAARYYGDTARMSEAFDKRDMGDETTNKIFNFTGKTIDFIDNVATVVDVVCSVAKLGIVYDYRIKKPGKSNINTRINKDTFFKGYDFSYKNVTRNLMKEMGFKITSGDLDTKTAFDFKKKFFAGDYNIDKFTKFTNGKKVWSAPEWSVKVFKVVKTFTNINKINSSISTFDHLLDPPPSNVKMTKLEEAIYDAEKIYNGTKAITDVIGFTKIGSVYGKYGIKVGETTGTVISAVVNLIDSASTSVATGAVQTPAPATSGGGGGGYAW